MKPAFFLDRDGVIVENRSNYILSWSDVKIFPQAVEALKKLAETAYPIIIITNQSPIGRGLVDIVNINTINDRLINIITSAGGRIDGVFLCPHAPQDNCSCRKPEPGLILEASKAFSVDIANSFLIGDALTDIAAGKAAGIKNLALVKTGRGKDQLKLPGTEKLKPFLVFENLKNAVDFFIDQSLTAGN